MLADDEHFIPAGCDNKVKGSPALTVGAGTRWLEAYDTVVNQHNRYVQGGGASTYGVITNVTLKTLELPANFGLLFGTIKAKNDAAYQLLILEIIFLYNRNLNNEHWGEQIRFSADNTVTFGMTFVNLNIEQITYAFAPLVMWISQHKKDYVMNVKPTIIPANKLWNLAYLKKSHPELFTLNQSADALPNQFWWATNSAEVSAY